MNGVTWRDEEWQFVGDAFQRRDTSVVMQWRSLPYSQHSVLNI